MKHQVMLSPDGQLMCPVCSNPIQEIHTIQYTNSPENWDTNPMQVEITDSSVAVYSNKEALLLFTNDDEMGLCTLYCRCTVCHLVKYAFMYKVNIKMKQGKIIFEFEDNDWPKHYQENKERLS